MTKNIFCKGLVAGIFLLAFISCQENLPQVNSPQNYPGDNYSEIFEGFWSGMNTNYVFWDVDQTNWDGVYKTYQPLFAALGAFNTANNALAEQYFTAMTATLIDSHYTITFEQTGHQVSPALNRKVAIDKQYPDSIYSLPVNFFTSVVRTHYLDAPSVIYGLDTVTSEGTKVPFVVMTGKLSSDKSILYLYISNFFFSQSGPNVTKALNSFFATLAASSTNLKGIIIDVRENGGGEVDDVSELVGSMVGSAYTYGYTHSKSGVGRLDFTPWVPAILRPVPGSVDFEKPVAILVDHLTVSAAELTALAVRAMPGGKGKIIGTTTWGANGPLLPSVYLNGGQFTIGATDFGNNGYMFVFTSSESFKGVKGTIYEGKGIPPDKWVAETSAAYGASQDLQLEAAVNYINNN